MIIERCAIYISTALMTGLSSTLAFADIACDKSYGLQVNVNGLPGVVTCDSSSTSFINNINNFERSNLNYTETSAASAFGRFNDVDVALGFAANSTTLVYSFPQIGNSGSFTGSTRKESQKQFEDYVKTSGIIGQIINYQAQHSPTSPLTGVGGLVPMTIASDFNANFSDSPTAIAGPSAAGSSNNNLLGAQLNYASFNVSNTSDQLKTTTIPLSYTIRNDIDPRRQLIFNVPLTYVEVGTAKTIQAGLGVSYRFPLTDQWTLTPSAGYAAVGSQDRAALASLYSASLTSAYVIPFDGFDVSIGNMLGYYATGKFTSSSFSYNPDLNYLATRNGVMLSHPVNWGSKMSIQYSLIGTNYLGSEKPYVDNFQEIGVTLGTNKSALDARSYVRGGLTYIQGPSIRGFKANIGYWF